MRVSEKRGVSTMDEQTLCICPKCGEKHYVMMYWTGTTEPKKFCKGCEGLVRRNNTEGI